MLNVKKFNKFIFLLIFTDFSLIYCQDFGYDGEKGPSHWGEQYNSCFGKHQSPININSLNVDNVKLPKLHLNGFDKKPLSTNLTNNGHTVMITMDTDEFPTVTGGPLNGLYEFNQLHFHWGDNDTFGSEDLIDGKSFAMELHMVFYKKKYRNSRSALDYPDGLTVLAFFYEIADKRNMEYDEFTKLLNKINAPHKSALFDNPPPLLKLIPENVDQYYTYNGSLTTPPCSEVVTWIDFKTPIYISHEQLDMFRALKNSEGLPLKHNFRPIQSLGDRRVLFNTGSCDGDECMNINDDLDNNKPNKINEILTNKLDETDDTEDKTNDNSIKLAMGCVEEGSTTCFVYNKVSCAEVKKIILLVRPSDTIAKLFDDVTRLINFEDYELVLQASKEAEPINLNDIQEFKTLSAVGFNFEQGSRNTLTVNPLRPNRRKYAISNSSPIGQDMYNDDDLALGASASPTEQDQDQEQEQELENEPSIISSNLPISSSMFECRDANSSQYKSSGKLYSGQRPAIGYVGLVNQAMTCYLNSLLQALFMTPEFRNALYNWEFDGIGESKSIPYQLQKLFLNLQTSPKFAVETTDLTKSFGWDSSEAWQQHDIQELCRVMFDALEQKFKNTKQADLINRLYEGKMMDYVKCLECSTEKSREDTFLDIPLPVRPFGSAAAYDSVEEALKAFVQPETLDGNNQYFCEKCNKKCDAHKGLKFTKFPYILTLHLKRFDFDYQTLHRIKLNDKVTFPQTLNLNSFIINPTSDLVNDTTNNDITVTATTSSSSSTISDNKNTDNLNKFDECSTTDSGSMIEEDSCNSATVNFMQTNNNNINDIQDEDEGIDMGINSFNKNNHVTNNNGPYIYELFSIMIHSGSASGGHYYAYIKDFETSEWYCFNDQNVTMITQEDIQKSFGGGNSKSYYSGAFSSSTNAYMLMYRQLDTVRNCAAIKTDNYPEHITNLLNKLKEKEDEDKKLKEYELEMYKLKVYFYNPLTHRMVDCKLYLTSYSTLEEALEEAYNRLMVNNIVPLDRCRLVGYCNNTEFIECSFEGKEKYNIGAIMNSLINPNELLLEIRDEDKEFEPYVSYGLLTQIYFINLITSEIYKPLIICNQASDTVLEYKKYIVKKLKLNNDNILLAMLKYQNEVMHIDDDTSTLLKEQIHPRTKIFVALNTEPDSKLKLQRFVEHYRHIITLYVNLPEIDNDTYIKLGIPDTDRIDKLENGNYEEEAVLKSAELSTTLHIPPPVQIAILPTTVAQTQPQPITTPVLTENLLRNVNDDAVDSSEDSSLSDGDRTLVESLDEVGNQINTLYDTPDCSEQQINIEIDEEYFDIVNIIKKQKKAFFYKIIKYDEPIWSFYLKLEKKFDDNDVANKKDVAPCLKIIVDKRMLFGQLKYILEKYIQVPMEYFYVFINQIYSMPSDKEHIKLTEDLNSLKDGDRLIIELGRVLKKGEFRCKIYYLKLSEVNEEAEQLDMLFEWVIKTGDNVAEIKKAMVKKYATNANIDINNIDMNKFRIRKKNTKNPGKIYLDDQFFGDDIALTAYSEFILQELEGEPIIPTDPDDIVLLVRRWSPSTLTLGKFEELLVTKDIDFSQLLSNISNIPVENIVYAKLSGLFPRCNLPTVYLNSFLGWSSQPITLNKWPLNISQDGYIYYYRDSTEILKEATPEEKREINGKENSRIDNKLGSIYSPRKERALKIYLDSSPKKVDD